MNNTFVSLHSLDIPNYMAPSAWVEHIPFAFDLINKLKPKVIVELGVYQGVSYFSFCQTIKASNLPSVCYGIDSWYGDEHASFYSEDIFEKVNAYNNANYIGFSTLLRCDFGKAVKDFKDKSIDLLHIDGLHTYEAVKNDFETWLPKLSDSSIVLFHDISVKDRGFGVYKLWEELSAIYPSFSFEHGFGLGVLATGPHIPETVLPLFKSGDTEKMQLRAIYHRLGLTFTEILERQEETRHKMETLQQLTSSQGQINDYKEKIKKLEDNVVRLSQQSRKIPALHHQIDSLNIELSELYASEGWKLLSFYYRFRNKLLPQGSTRFNNIKKTINWLRRKKGDNVILENHLKKGMNRYARTSPTRFEPFDFPYFSEPKVSVIIPAYNGWEMNYLCLRSIWENTDGVSYEVIFADDVSSDETQNVGSLIKNIVYLRNEQNLGFLQNCNHAASFARGEYIHFLNNDTEVTTDWLSSLVNLMEKDKTIGLAGSKLVYPDGRLQEAGGIIWKDGSGWNYGHGQDPEAPEYNYVKEVDYISGASIMIRKSLWQQLGGFDKRYSPAYCEDSDFAFATRKQGYKVVYQPLSQVIHFEGFSHGTDTGSPGDTTNIKAYQKANTVKFLEKWQPELQLQYPTGINAYWTRDRSHHKKTIVVIDHYVPQFDKDAGSRTTFQYLELFTEMGLNVKFIGDNFYRTEPYTTILQQKGIEVLYGTQIAKNLSGWLTDNEQYIDYIFLNRPHISIKHIDFIKNKLHGKIFYYTHDLHYIRELMEYEVTQNPQKLKSSNEWRRIEYSIFQKSDVVLTPSTKEKETLESDFPGKPIQVMPAFFYPSINDPIRNFNDRKDILFVGGFSHRPNVDAINWYATEILPVIKKTNENIRLIIVGSNAPDEIVKLASPNIIFRGFVTDEELDLIYNSVRFSIIPLRFGAGLKGKTVESLAKALPVVSTSFGVEGLQDIGDIAPSYDTAIAFAEAVTTLYEDTEKLKKLSAAVTIYSRQHFTKDRAKLFFNNLFDL